MCPYGPHPTRPRAQLIRQKSCLHAHSRLLLGRTLYLSTLILLVFARKMLTFWNQPLCSSNLSCLTFDFSLLSVSATFAGLTEGPRKSPLPVLAWRGCGNSTRLAGRCMPSPFPRAELWKIKGLGAIRTPQPPLLLNCQPLSILFLPGSQHLDLGWGGMGREGNLLERGPTNLRAEGFGPGEWAEELH